MNDKQEDTGLIRCKQAATKLASLMKDKPGFNGVESGILTRNKRLGMRIYFKLTPPRSYCVPSEIDGFEIDIIDESRPINI